MTALGGRRRLRVGACLSLTGRYAQFGLQAAHGLAAWRELDGNAEVLVEDDASSPAQLAACLPVMAARCDLLLGPYSTQLMRAATRLVSELDHVVWNHGGSGDDVEVACPGQVVSILTPAGRYAERFVGHRAAETVRAPLWLAEGRGSFGRQVAAGAQRIAHDLGLQPVRLGAGDTLPTDHDGRAWDLLCAGLFEEDVARVDGALALAQPPRRLCAIAAGVRSFGEAVARSEGVFGIAQWFPGSVPAADLGPAERDFVSVYRRSTGTAPDYPAVQAAAAAVVGTHCARVAGDLSRDSLWGAAASLDATTLFGPFRIDPVSGAQRGHETVVVRWTPRGLALASAASEARSAKVPLREMPGRTEGQDEPRPPAPAG